jgi:hypothetical protein
MSPSFQLKPKAASMEMRRKLTASSLKETAILNPAIPAAVAVQGGNVYNQRAEGEKNERLQDLVEYGSDVRHGVREHRRVRDVQ